MKLLSVCFFTCLLLFLCGCSTVLNQSNDNDVILKQAQAVCKDELICKYAFSAIKTNDPYECTKIKKDYSAGFMSDIDWAYKVTGCMLFVAKQTNDVAICDIIRSYDPDDEGLISDSPTQECYKYFNLSKKTPPPVSNTKPDSEAEKKPSNLEVVQNISSSSAQMDKLVLECKFENTYTCQDGETPLEAKNVFFANGKEGKGIELKPGASLIYPYEENFNIKQGTIQFWFKPDTSLLDSQTHLFFQHQSPSDNANLRFRLLLSSQNGACNHCYETYIYTGEDQGASKELSEEDEDLNSWYYMATTWDSSTIKIYLNGILLDTYTGKMNIGSPSDRIYIGSYYPVGDFAVANGIMDELKIYNYVRTESQIKEDFKPT